MLILAECIRILTTWQAIPFKRNFYVELLWSLQLREIAFKLNLTENKHNGDKYCYTDMFRSSSCGSLYYGVCLQILLPYNSDSLNEI